MAAAPFHMDGDVVRPGHQRAAAVAHHAARQVGGDVQAVDGLHVLERTGFDHGLGAEAGHLAIGVGLHRRALFGGLEDELHGAGQLRLHARQHLGRAHQHGGVGVVAAGVHHGHFLAQIGGLGLARKGQAGVLQHRQRVHVGAQGHHLARQAALERAHHAGAAHAGLHLHAQLLQVLGHQLGGAHLLAREFGVGMDVAAPVDHLGRHGVHGGVDGLQAGGIQRLGLGRRDKSQPAGDEAGGNRDGREGFVHGQIRRE